MTVKPPTDWRPTVYRARSQILWFNLHKTLSRSSPTLQVRDWSSEKVSNLPKVTQLLWGQAFMNPKLFPPHCLRPRGRQVLPSCLPHQHYGGGTTASFRAIHRTHFPRPTFRTYVLMVENENWNVFPHSSPQFSVNLFKSHRTTYFGCASGSPSTTNQHIHWLR